MLHCLCATPYRQT